VTTWDTSLVTIKGLSKGKVYCYSVAASNSQAALMWLIHMCKMTPPYYMGAWVCVRACEWVWVWELEAATWHLNMLHTSQGGSYVTHSCVSLPPTCRHLLCDSFICVRQPFHITFQNFQVDLKKKIWRFFYSTGTYESITLWYKLSHCATTN